MFGHTALYVIEKFAEMIIEFVLCRFNSDKSSLTLRMYDKDQRITDEYLLFIAFTYWVIR